MSASPSFENINPTTGKSIGRFLYSKENEIFDALNCLNQGLIQDLNSNQNIHWADLSFSQRQQQLKKFLEGLERHKSSIALLIVNHMGKPISQAEAEVKKSIAAVKYLVEHSEFEILMSANMTHLNFKSSVSGDTRQHQFLVKPKGVIVGLMPWNFPLWQAVRMFMPALLMGNRVLLKHSEITAVIGDKLELIFEECGLGSILQHCVWTHDLTEKIIADPRVGGVSLTGSTQAGFKIAELCARYLKKSVLELGGSDVSIMCDDADIILAVEKTLEARLQNTGQSCIALKRFLIPQKKMQAVCELIQEKMKGYKFGDVLDANTRLGSLAHSRFLNENEEKVKYLQTEFKTLVEIKNTESKNENTAFAPVRVLTCENYNTLSQEMKTFLQTCELFSPTLLVFGYHSPEEAIAIANSTVYGLGGSVFSADIQQAKNIATKINSGMLAINDYVRSDVALPFGGVKSSGWGKEFGPTSYFEFVDLQLVSW